MNEETTKNLLKAHKTYKPKKMLKEQDFPEVKLGIYNSVLGIILPYLLTKTKIQTRAEHDLISWMGYKVILVKADNYLYFEESKSKIKLSFDTISGDYRFISGDENKFRKFLKNRFEKQIQEKIDNNKE